MAQPTNVTIRKARPDEAPVLQRLTGRSALYWGYESEFLEWEPESLAVNPEFISNSVVYLLEEETRITGYYALTGNPESLALDKLFVEPDLIGTGRGKRLWLHAIEIAHSMGVTEFYFYADPNAAPFYRAMGAEWLESIPTTRADWDLQRFRFAIPVKD